MVVTPFKENYWIENDSSGESVELSPRYVRFSTNLEQSSSKFEIESNDSAKFYRQRFVNSEHLNIVAFDAANSPALISIKTGSLSAQYDTNIIIRQKSGTTHKTLPASCIETYSNLDQITRLLSNNIKIQHYEALIHPMTSALITEYDEKQLISHFKFGVLYQKFGQILEEELFSNVETSQSFEDFLDLIGRRIKLKDHKGYAGGLDVKSNHTGEFALYEVFENHEIIFHVSTMLPFSKTDDQQLEKKRHIGNDICIVIFQVSLSPTLSIKS